jgi:hypothetical protein
MIDGAGLEGPRRLSPPQLTTPKKSCFQPNKSVDGLALDNSCFLFRRRPVEAGRG